MSDPMPSMTQRLAAMHELHFELSAAESTDEVCRRAVSRGRFYTGIDRIGIWLLDLDDPRWFFGSYGIDEIGSVRDERSSRVPLDPHVYDADFFERRVPYRFMPGHSVYDDTHREVGRADLVVAPMWNGTLSIGTVCADTFLNRRSMTEDDCELAALLARMVGHLVTIKRSEEKLRESAYELERLATTDELTGFLNRRTGIQLLEHLITLSRRTSDTVSVCFLDLDRLKRINDTLGHRADLAMYAQKRAHKRW